MKHRTQAPPFIVVAFMLLFKALSGVVAACIDSFLQQMQEPLPRECSYLMGELNGNGKYFSPSLTFFLGASDTATHFMPKLVAIWFWVLFCCLA